MIVGQGLAGTCLIAELQRLGKSVLVVDSAVLPSASWVAGGLFNPVTGRGMVLTWKAKELFSFLNEFYSRLEVELDQNFLHLMPLYRPFGNVEELNLWQGRLSQDKFAPFIEKIDTAPSFSSLIHNPLGGITLKGTGYLDTTLLINSSRTKLIEEQSLLDEKFNPEEINFNSDKIVYKGYSATRVIFADGPLGFGNKLVEKIRFQALKGEVLQLDIDDKSEVIINRNGFVIPRNGGHIAGSNYDPRGKDWEPTEAARAEITAKIDTFMKADYRVTGQRAGLRPTTHDRRPVLGIHPENDRVGIFNGLGTKGVSLAPYFARQLAEHLVFGKEIEKEVRISRYFS